MWEGGSLALWVKWRDWWKFDKADVGFFFVCVLVPQLFQKSLLN